MTDIVTLTLNPALDLSTATDRVTSGPKLRCDAPRAEPGGGGINVSRVIARLGGTSQAFVALGGATGTRLSALLDSEGLTPTVLPLDGETRQSLAVTDRADDNQYRFVLPGPTWSRADVATVLDRLDADVENGAVVVVSGSQPPGVPDDLVSRIVARLAARGARLFVDTSGPALERLARGGDAPVAILRMDSAEAEALAGRDLPDRNDSAAFALDLVSRGAAEAVIVARGAEGSVLVTGTDAWHVAAADVPVVSKIGAGDSFVGACALALAMGASLPDALVDGAAAASATVTSEGTALCRAEDVARLRAHCPVSRI